MEPATLLQHYGAQLETQGWTKVSPAAPAVIAFWTRRDSSGATQIATLRVQIMPGVPTCREAFMDITTSRSR
jgi:hypothetical protein